MVVGLVGRAVPSDSKGPQFESSKSATFYTEHEFTVNVEKTKIKRGRYIFSKIICYYLAEEKRSLANVNIIKQKESRLTSKGK